MLLAHQLPPRGMGGNTEVRSRSHRFPYFQNADGVQFADSRTAYDDLDQSTKDQIEDYALNHSQHWSRKKANPGHPLLEEPRVSLSPVQAGLYRMKEVLMGDSSSRNPTRSGSIDWSRSMNLVVVK